jgi:protein TonB
MHFGTASQPSSRLASVGLVIGLHVLMVYGLSSSLVRDALQKPSVTPQLAVLKDPTPPPVQPLPVQQSQPLATPVTAVVRVPDVPTFDTMPLMAVPTQPSFSQSHEAAPSGSTATPEPTAPIHTSRPAVQAAGMLCAVMPRPELPPQALEGQAELRVLGTVRGGRVTGVEIQALRAFSDRRAQRALLASVEHTMRSGYQCASDGVFVQEFVFRVD